VRSEGRQHFPQNCRMGAMTVVTHVLESTENLLKLPPKLPIRRTKSPKASFPGNLSFGSTVF
jgi:hypothetical protein